MDPSLVEALENAMTDLWRRGRADVRARAREVHPDLDPATFPLALSLHHEGAPVRIGDLGVRLLLDKSTVSRQVDSLVRVGLAQRLPDPDDARVRLVDLTPDGRERVSRVQHDQLSRWRATVATWSAEDVARLTALLDRLVLPREG